MYGQWQGGRVRGIMASAVRSGKVIFSMYAHTYIRVRFSRTQTARIDIYIKQVTLIHAWIPHYTIREQQSSRGQIDTGGAG